MASSSPGFLNHIFHTTRYIKIWGPGPWPRLHLAFRTTSSTLQGTYRYGVPGHSLVFIWLSEPHLQHYKVNKGRGSRVMASSSPGFQDLIFHTTRYIKIWGPGSWPLLLLVFRTTSFTLQGMGPGSWPPLHLVLKVPKREIFDHSDFPHKVFMDR